jgi:hypothetical protein
MKIQSSNMQTQFNQQFDSDKETIQFSQEQISSLISQHQNNLSEKKTDIGVAFANLGLSAFVGFVFPFIAPLALISGGLSIAQISQRTKDAALISKEINRLSAQLKNFDNLNRADEIEYNT